MFSAMHAEGVKILGVSMDGENVEGAKKVLKERAPTYPQVILQESSMKEAGLALDAGLPFTLVLNAQLRPTYAFRGKVTKPEVEAALRALVR